MTQEPDLLPVALRAYSEPCDWKAPVTDAKQQSRLLKHRRRDNHRPVLIFDFETRTDPSQRPMFGVWRFCRWQNGRLVCLLEGLIYADDLSESELEVMRGYHRLHKMTTAADQSVPDSAPTLWISSEQQFVKLIYRYCHEPGPARAAALVGFNLNFDISRLARDWGESQTKKYANGFTLRLHDGYTNNEGEWRESPHHPRYGAKHLASTKALRGWIAKFSGHIIDVRTLAFALTNRGHSLESGCEAFRVVMPEHLRPFEGPPTPANPSPARKPYGYAKRDVDYGVVSHEAITYCRDDVEATQRLYEHVIREFDRHPIPLQASQAYSPASVGKAYLAGMGIRPRLELQPNFPREQLGVAMSAFYGGRVECRIRGASPVTYLDLLSAYTTANSLMDLWRFVIAQRVELLDATDEVRTLVERIGLDDCLDPATWPSFPALVQVKPDRDVLPLRGRYQRTAWNIGSNHLTDDELWWFGLPDVMASKLTTDRTPEIVRALKLTAHGVQPGLRRSRLRGEIEIDPRENFFRTVIERRHELGNKKSDLSQFLKTLANAASYGVYAEMVRTELPDRKTERVKVHDWMGESYDLDERNPERPGRYFFAPMAALITAGTRLLLAICERLVTDQGSTWAMMDTDSAAIVSTEHGGLVPCPGGPHRDDEGRECVRALSWARVDEIRERMQRLNPYGGAAGSKPILELEDENFDKRTGKRRQLYCYAIRSKGYCLYNLDERGEPMLRGATMPDQHPEEEARAPVIRRRSDHGLGYLINPINPDSDSRDYILEGWEWVLRCVLGLDAPEPSYFDRPALMRAAITTPGLLGCFEQWNAGKPRGEQMRPFNFYMVARVKPHVRDELTGHDWAAPVGQKFALMIPFESKPECWEDIEATNRYEPGARYRITSREDAWLLEAQPDLLPVRTFRDVFHEYRESAEPKSLGPDGLPCHADTHGLLHRRHVRPAAVTSIGKEMNALEEQLAGLRTEADVQNTYQRPGEDPLWQLTVRALNIWTVEEVATDRRTKVHPDTVIRARANKTVTTATRENLVYFAFIKAARELRAAGRGVWKAGREAVLATYLDHVEHQAGKRKCALPECENAARPRGNYCSERHARNAADRRRRARLKATA